MKDQMLKIVNANYITLQNACKEVCKRNGHQFSEDIFQDTIIRLYDAIEKKGALDDMSESGIMNYFVRSYVNNLMEQQRYAYYKKRDLNVTNEELTELFEKQLSPVNEKIIKDMKEDFSILYICKMVELNFSPEHYYLFKLKTLCNMTYKQIYDKTQIKKSRDKILEVKRWIKENLSREIINKEFRELYSDLIND